MKQKLPTDFATDLLKLVIRRISYFEAHPSHLAWVMMHYSTLFYRGRVLFDEWLNPKDPLLDMRDLTQAQQNLVYDSWAVTISNNPEFNDAVLPLEKKAGKTVEEWVSLKLDPRYRYRSLYRDARSVHNHLLCTIGTGMKWVEENGVSYVAHVEASGINTAKFAGYTKAGRKIDPEIRREVLRIADRFGCLRCIDRYIKNGIKAARGWEWDLVSKRAILVPPHQTTMAKLLKKRGKNKQPKPRSTKRHDYYPLCERYSNLMTMPKNAHHSYWRTGVRVACEIISNPASKPESIRLAHKFLRKARQCLKF
jgi:hypothetical protein